jgi:hypothetical protein
MNKFIIDNIKYLNQDHQTYIYHLINQNSHSQNQNGSFFKLSDLTEIQISYIYDFMKKIELQSSINDNRTIILSDLLQDLDLDKTIEHTISPKSSTNTPATPVTPVSKEYDMDEIEKKMKETLKGPKYKPGTVHHRILQNIRNNNRRNKIRVQKHYDYGFNADHEDTDLDEDHEPNEDPDELNEDPDELNDDPDQPIDESDLDEDSDHENDNLTQLQLQMTSLLISHGYSLTDNNQLTVEPYLA